jgi:hypothetical protein
MPESMRSLSYPSPEERRSHRRGRTAPLEPGTSFPEPPAPPVDEFDNPEFNALVDQAVSKPVKQREFRKSKTGPSGEDIARFRTELVESVRKEKQRETEAYERLEDPEFNALMDTTVAKIRNQKPEAPRSRLQKMQEDIESIDRKYPRSTRQEARSDVRLAEHKLPAQAEEEKVIVRLRKEIQPKDEVQTLQTKLQKMNREEGKIHEQLNELRRNRSIGARIGRWLSRLTGNTLETPEEATIRSLENDLEILNSEQQDLMEEIQTLTHKASLEALRRSQIARPRGLPITPKRVLAEDQLRRKAREEDRIAAQQLETPTLGMEEEGAEVVYGLATPEEARKRVSDRKKRKAPAQAFSEDSIDVDLSDMDTPKPEQQDVAKEQAEPSKEKREGNETESMTVDRAAELLGGKPRAAAIWDKVMDAMKKKPGMDDDILLAVGEARRSGRQEVPATLYVFTLAEAERALQAGDEGAYKEAMKNIGRWNDLLGLNLEDVIGKKPVQIDRLSGVKQRRETVNRTNTRNRF